MIRTVENARDVRSFVAFQLRLYEGDPHFVPPILVLHRHELKRELLVRKSARAILCESAGRIRGRLLFAFGNDRKRGEEVCWFSHFEAEDDDGVAAELFAAMEAAMRSRGVRHAEGSYTPFDPDTRRGILVDGFDDDPSFLLSYNKPYYGRMLERVGFRGVLDTVAFSGDANPAATTLLTSLGTRFDAKHRVRIEPLSFRRIDRDVADVHRILARATTAMNYQEAPSLAMIRAVADSLRFFLDPELVLIARNEADGEPLGFVLVVPDFNRILKRTRGRIRPLVFLSGSRHIDRARAMMQYVVPEWQNTGLIFRLYRSIEERFRARGIRTIEGGTIVAENVKSFGAFLKLGCRIAKTMRIYGKDLEP